MKKLLLVSLTTLFSLCGYSQTKGQVLENGISSTTVWKSEFTSGKELKIKESFKRFNEKGLVIEEIDYNKDGLQKERVELKYDELKNVIEKKIFDKNNKHFETIKYVYDANLKTSKEVYNNKEKLTSKKIYVYEKD